MRSVLGALKNRLLEQLDPSRRASFGLDGLDRKMAEHVRGYFGFFIEAGANDGLSQSNTRYLEKYRGWRGILVEPIPELAEKCERSRSLSTVERCALVASDDTRSRVEMTYCNLMSIVDGARGSSSADSRHIERGLQYLSAGDSIRKVSAPSRTLDQVLRQHGVRRWDLLSLDVEGYEAQALKGIDFERLAPSWILVEANDPEAIEDVLAGRYDLVAQLSHHDRLYRINRGLTIQR